MTYTIYLNWWYGSQEEESVLNRSGYPVRTEFQTDEDPFEIARKLYANNVTVVIHKVQELYHGSKYVISVCDDSRPGQR
jgi:hypothetical protein